MQKIHQDILNFLVKKRKDDPNLLFTLRITNRYERLDQGYWFHGNDDYVSISFWSGMDYNNRTPNIFFRVLKDGSSSLELSAKDSDQKWFFFSEIIPKSINGLESFGKKKLIKGYSHYKDKYLDSLESFLNNDKKIIDKALMSVPEELEKEVFSFKNNDLGFLNKKEFLSKLDKILNYKPSGKVGKRKSLPFFLKRIEIKNFPPINKTVIDNINSYNQWIFLTGMNGTGKSSILKALTIAITNNSDAGKNIVEKTEKDFTIKLRTKNYSKRNDFTIDSKTLYVNKLNAIGFSAYGASRQMLQEEDISKKSSLAYNIFNNDGKLLDLNNQITDTIKKGDANSSERIDQISLLLADLIPSLVNIELPEKTLNGLYTETLYTEEDEEGNKLPTVTFDQLASGLKSLVAMIGDMCSRLFAQQKDISDPAELKGIVIIDEIDIHLHPVLQKKIVELLTDTFPLIQFIASTHSPVPFLGAPENTVIYNVTRTSKDGTIAKRIKNVNIENLLPNTLLTSPIFGMESLAPTSNVNVNNLNIDDHFNDKKLFKMVDEKIDELFEKGKSKASKYFE